MAVQFFDLLASKRLFFCAQKRAPKLPFDAKPETSMNGVAVRCFRLGEWDLTPSLYPACPSTAAFYLFSSPFSVLHFGLFCWFRVLSRLFLNSAKQGEQFRQERQEHLIHTAVLKVSLLPLTEISISVVSVWICYRRRSEFCSVCKCWIIAAVLLKSQSGLFFQSDLYQSIHLVPCLRYWRKCCIALQLFFCSESICGFCLSISQDNCRQQIHLPLSPHQKFDSAEWNNFHSQEFLPL